MSATGAAQLEGRHESSRYLFFQAIVFRTGGQMKSSEIFEECHGRYRRLREELNDGKGRVRPLVLDRPANGYSWRPTRARACEYVADFERIGRNALRRPEWKGRLKLFETYFLEGVEYRRAISLVGVAEGTFDYWFREVKRAVGAEFSRTGLFPPSRYFQATNQRMVGSSENRGRNAVACIEPIVNSPQRDPDRTTFNVSAAEQSLSV